MLLEWITAVLWILVGALATEVQDCGSTGRVLATTVQGCENSPCVVHRGTNISVNIRFRSVRLVHVLTPTVLGVLESGLEVPLVELDHDDACNRLSEGRCPLDGAEEVTYSTFIPLEKDFPKVQGDVRWTLTDQDNATVVCVQVPAESV